jgi:hypothetical protein
VSRGATTAVIRDWAGGTVAPSNRLSDRRGQIVGPSATSKPTSRSAERVAAGRSCRRRWPLVGDLDRLCAVRSMQTINVW